MLKKQISKDWLDAFPELRPYSTNRFYKILGPIIIGIELVKLPRVEQYRPHFTVYSLCGNKIGNDLKSCMSGPMVLEQFFDNKGLQFSIPYKEHINYFPEAKKAARKQLLISTEGDISLEKAFNSLKEFSKKPPMGVSPSSYLQAMYFEALLKIALYCDAIEEIDSILNLIESRDWNSKHFKLFKTDVLSWRIEIGKMVNNKSNIVSIVGSNLESPKLSSLLKSKLI